MLDEMYGRICKIWKREASFAMPSPYCSGCAFSNRPLRLLEIREVLAIENGDNGGFFPDERLPDPADAAVVCSTERSAALLAE
jgi:hypothetical protein